MKRPKLRKASKRMTCAKKYRIRKNVANHNRKQRKLAKKNKGNKVKQRDPGIPGSAPFKEEVLREAEVKKEQLIEEKNQRRKDLREANLNKRRGLESLQADAMNRQKQFEEKNQTINQISDDVIMGSNKEFSKKAYYKEFQKVVENSDVIIEVLDARDPLGCRCLDMEKMILNSGDKKIVLLLNKIDLIPRENVEEWLKYLRNEFPAVAFKANTQTQSYLGHHKVPIHVITKEILSNTSQCVGADSVLKLLSNYCRNLNLQTSIRVGVVGFPNVGKSSVINSLKRSRACDVGSVPGVTKSMQEVALNKHIKILDCPGIVMATGSSPSAMVLRNCVNVSTLDDPVSPVEAILNRCKKDEIMLRYQVGNYGDVNEFLELLAKKKGKLKRGGVPDIDVAAKIILSDWNNGKISYYTRPPEDKPTIHVKSKIVDKMAQEFDWESLEQDNLNALQSVRGCPTHSNSLLYKSSGPSEMVVEDDDADDVTMDDDQSVKDKTDELGDYTIEVKEKKKRKSTKRDESEKSRVDDLDKILADGSNIQANKSIKQVMKMNKKKRKRADKLSDKLGETLLSSMKLSSSGADNYDFNVDMNL